MVLEASHACICTHCPACRRHVQSSLQMMNIPSLYTAQHAKHTHVRAGVKHARWLGRPASIPSVLHAHPLEHLPVLSLCRSRCGRCLVTPSTPAATTMLPSMLCSVGPCQQQLHLPGKAAAAAPRHSLEAAHEGGPAAPVVPGKLRRASASQLRRLCCGRARRMGPCPWQKQAWMRLERLQLGHGASCRPLLPKVRSCALPT